MAEWSDGKVRADSYHGNALDIAIEQYFDKRNEEERLQLKWDNEAMRKDRQTEKVRTATA